MAPKRYLSQVDVAEYAGVSEGTIRSMRSRREGNFPDPDVIIGVAENARPVPGWRESTVLKWLERRPEQRREFRPIKIVRRSDYDDSRRWIRIVRTLAKQWNLTPDQAQIRLLALFDNPNVTAVTIPAYETRQQ